MEKNILVQELQGYSKDRAPAPFITVHYNYLNSLVRPIDISINHIVTISPYFDEHGLNRTQISTIFENEIYSCVEDREEIHSKIYNVMEYLRKSL